MAKKQRGREKLKFAVVGLGHIAQAAVLPAFRHAQEAVELTALVSGDDEKLSELGSRYHVPNLYTYEQYDRMLDEGTVQAVYIALPNHQHADYAVRALERGVHVLCEKPLATTEDDCRRMVEAGRESGAKLMTAYRLHFDEANLKAIRLARDRLGNLRYFNSTFSFNLSDPGNIRLRAIEGGGPLWDIGVYCINQARSFFADEPIEVTGLATTGEDPRFTEVPENVAVTMKFPGERIASFTCGFGCGASSAYDLLGEKGRLHAENAYEYKEARSFTLEIGDETEKFHFKKADQFAPELIYFADCVRRNRVPETSGFEGWADVRIILAIEESIRSKRAVTLGTPPHALADKERPDLGQWIQKPPVQEPPMVEGGKGKGKGEAA